MCMCVCCADVSGKVLSESGPAEEDVDPADVGSSAAADVSIVMKQNPLLQSLLWVELLHHSGSF